jgi:arylsulfatase A-like enzyme
VRRCRETAAASGPGDRFFIRRRTAIKSADEVEEILTAAENIAARQSVAMCRLFAAIVVVVWAIPALAAPPNVVLVLTDDQAYGDVGRHGNPVLKTPHIDHFANQAVECTHFYACPVCAPTRASLMTGRYYYRTDVTDTYNGRALMRPDEVTLAQLLAAAGYRTGLFGKWHLGDNYPLRPQDRGFHEVLMHRGGGIGQPSDPPGSSYDHPVLEHNGKLEAFDRYCTDLFTDEAIKFIEESKGRPFFVYLPYNCPHTPLQSPAAETAIYSKLDLTPAAFPQIGQPWPSPKLRPDLLARLYGMVGNIDSNFGRLLAKLDELKLADNSIVIFLSDNGPQEGRYNAGLRGLKGSVYEGGIRVPCFVRWPAGHIVGGRRVDAACAPIDIVPTIAAACGVPLPAGRTIDGLNLLPAWRGEPPPMRTLFVQWHRGDAPEKFRACAVRGPRYKLVQATGARANADFVPLFELFDILADPFEQRDCANQEPEIVGKMMGEYGHWFADVTKGGFASVRPQLGTSHENPTRLTRQDWRGPKSANWEGKGLGYWEVNLPTPGTFDVTVTLKGIANNATVHFRLGDVTAAKPVGAGTATLTFRALKFPAGDARLETWIELAGESAGVWDVEVKRVD